MREVTLIFDANTITTVLLQMPLLLLKIVRQFYQRCLSSMKLVNLEYIWSKFSNKMCGNT